MADPTTVPDLRAWFKADSLATTTTSISSWSNSAPGFSAEAATQATASKMPTYSTSGLNGLPIIAFDGSSDVLALTGTLLDVFRNLGGATVFAVARETTPASTSTTSSAGNILHASTGGATGAARVAHSAMKSTAGAQEDTLRIGGRRLDSDTSFSNQAAPNDSWLVNAWKVATGVFDWAGAALRLYLNGSLAAEDTTFQTAGLTSDTRSLGGGIGANSANTGEYLQGGIAEILVYRRVLTVSERAEVHSYLSDRYGITVSDYVASSVSFSPADAHHTHIAGSPAVAQPTSARHGHSADSSSLTHVVAPVLADFAPVDARHRSTANTTELSGLPVKLSPAPTGPMAITMAVRPAGYATLRHRGTARVTMTARATGHARMLVRGNA